MRKQSAASEIRLPRFAWKYLFMETHNCGATGMHSCNLAGRSEADSKITRSENLNKNKEMTHWTKKVVRGTRAHSHNGLDQFNSKRALLLVKCTLHDW